MIEPGRESGPSALGSEPALTSLPSEAQLELMTSEQQAQNSEPARGYVWRHWHGYVSLGHAYWLNLVAISSCVPAAMFVAFTVIAKDDVPLRLIASGMVVILTVSLVMWVWGIVGVWRAADRHPGKRFWAVAAKVMVVLSIVTTAGHIARSYGPQLREYVLIAAGADPIGSYKVTVLSGGRAILVEGVLREGSVHDIERIITATPGAETLVLSSAGGRLLEAKTLADIVRARGLSTYVEDRCESACTFVFIAGKDRVAAKTAKIGFHAATFPGVSDNVASEFARTVYREAGVPHSFIERALSIPHQEMWYPRHEELINAGIVTRTSLAAPSPSPRSSSPRPGSAR